MTAPTVPTTGTSTWSGTSSASEVTSSISWQTGDLIVVVGATEDQPFTLALPTATGLTFSLIDSETASGGCNVYLWTATAGSNGSSAITSTITGGGAARGLWAWVLRGHDGMGAEVSFNTTTAKTFSLTRTGTDSWVGLVIADWAAINDTAVTASPATDGTQRIAQNVSGAATFFVFDWTNQGAAGTTSYGIANHTGTMSNRAIVVEVKGTAGGGGATAAPAVIAAVSSVPKAAVAAAATPAVAATATTAPKAAVATAAAPALAAATATIPRPAVAASAGPAVVATAATVPRPGVAAGATPAVAATVAAIPVPSTSAGAAATPAAAATAASVPRAAVAAGAAPGTVPTTTTVPTPGTAGSTTATPAAVSAAAAIPKPQVAVGVAAAAIAALVGLPAPTVSGGGGPATAQPPTIAVLATGPRAAVAASARPAQVLVVVTMPAPGVYVGAVIHIDAAGPLTARWTATGARHRRTAGQLRQRIHADDLGGIE